MKVNDLSTSSFSPNVNNRVYTSNYRLQKKTFKQSKVIYRTISWIGASSRKETYSAAF